LKKILIAEDDNFLANAYRVKLEKAGFEVRIAVNGDQVLEIVKEFIPDLLILDLIMPVRDGFETLAALKASEKYKNLNVIISSNLGQQEDIDKAMSLGAKDFIVKSNISLHQLVEKINSIDN
jgi:two-component system alkaline phosphatase synthesis response regulator PhoP